jgi:hypothetical protein
MKRKVFERNMDTPDELLARILGAAARTRNVNINPDEQNAICAHELQSALTLTVGSSNI